MPRISSFYGIHIYMYWRDHAPPHFHAIYSGQDASVLIGNGNIDEGQLPKRAARMAKEWALLHQTDLIDNWHRAQRGEALNPIPPLV